MSLNGITGYNNYSYSNPYTVNNTYANTYSNAGTTAFQGYDPTAMYSTTATAEKEDSGNPLLAMGAGIAAIGTAIYAVKRGKTIKLAGLTDDAAKQADNLKGVKGLWDNFTTGVKSLFTKAGRKEYKYSKELTSAMDIAKAAQEGKLTQEMSENIKQSAAKTRVAQDIKDGKIALTSIKDETGKKLTGEALENAKKARKEEFAKAVEETKKTITNDDIIEESANNAIFSASKLGTLRTAKSWLEDIKNNKEISVDTVKDFFGYTPSILNKVIKDDKVDTEALKNILEKIA